LKKKILKLTAFIKPYTTNYPGLVSESCHESTFKLTRHHNFMTFYFQSGQLGHSTNPTVILKSNEHKSSAWVFGVIQKKNVCTFQSSQFFDRLSMHFGVVDNVRASALFTADRRSPSWNRITDRTHAPPFGKRGE
jgi:hypothetical protein